MLWWFLAELQLNPLSYHPLKQNIAKVDFVVYSTVDICQEKYGKKLQDNKTGAFTIKVCTNKLQLINLFQPQQHIENSRKHIWVSIHLD